MNDSDRNYHQNVALARIRDEFYQQQLQHKYGSRQSRHHGNGYGINWDEGGIYQEKKPKTLRGTMHRFAATTSLQGVPFINRSGRWYSKVIWSFLFLAALAVMFYHLYTIFYKYYAAKTTSSVQLGYATLGFPSVTICNLNPIRKSAVIETPPSFQEFLGNITIDSDVFPEFDINRTTNIPGSTTQGPAAQRKKRQADRRVPYRRSDMIGINTNWTTDGYDQFVDFSIEDLDNFGYGQRASNHRLMEKYTEELGHLGQNLRKSIGHQSNIMITSCNFNGMQCGPENFTQLWLREYGNCYTFNSPPLRRKSVRSRRSGTQYGLRLVLYIEDHEMIETLTQGRGVRVNVHQFNTMPFPVETGMSAAPGFETFLGIRMVNATQLEDPFYGGCGDGGLYTDYYHHKYAVEGCVNTCLDRKIAEYCKCHRSAFPRFYNKEDRQNLRRCWRPKEMKCVWNWFDKISERKVFCNCPDACNEITFDVIGSANKWPTKDLWGPLVNQVCYQDPVGCEYLQNAGGNDFQTRQNVLRENFLAVNIYYRDLNYQNIEETPEYEFFQFLSDIGGTIGLWVGASILTGAEVIYLVIHLLAFCCRNREIQNYSTGTLSHISHNNMRSALHTNLGGGSSVISGLPNQNKFGVDYIRNPYYNT